MSQNKIPICANCKHYEEYESFYAGPWEKERFSRCKRNSFSMASTSIVTGEVTVEEKNLYCSIERRDDWLHSRMLGSCGKKGRFYEPK